MALEDGDLVSIDALPAGKISNNGALIPAQLGVHMTRGQTDPVYNLPYQYAQDYHFYTTNIATLTAGGVTWAATFQDPLQRVLLDIEIVAQDDNAAWLGGSLTGFQITTVGLDGYCLYTPVQAGVNSANNIYGLTVTSGAPITQGDYPMGQQYRFNAEGRLVFPVKILFISSKPLAVGEESRKLSVNLKLTTKDYGSYLPSGVVRVNPMPTDVDIAMSL